MILQRLGDLEHMLSSLFPNPIPSQIPEKKRQPHTKKLRYYLGFIVDLALPFAFPGR